MIPPRPTPDAAGWTGSISAMSCKMTRSLNPIRIAGPLALCACLVTGAQANMPALTPKPTPPSPVTCQRWAAMQDEDAAYMWGMQESGGSSKTLAIARLTAFCLGKKPPEIVGFGSSVGFDDAFCATHQSATICQGR